MHGQSNNHHYVTLPFLNEKIFLNVTACSLTFSLEYMYTIFFKIFSSSIYVRPDPLNLVFALVVMSEKNAAYKS